VFHEKQENNPCIPAEESPQQIFSRLCAHYPDDICAKAEVIIQAESNWNPKAKNPTSTASGLFQFIKGTWEYHCKGHVFDPEDNIACGLRLLDQGGDRHWDASAHVWREMLE